MKARKQDVEGDRQEVPVAGDGAIELVNKEKRLDLVDGDLEDRRHTNTIDEDRNRILRNK